MEKQINLKAFDGKEIACWLNTTKKKNDVAVVFVHGLTGHPNEHLYFNAARQYPEKGVDVFRFALYEYGENKRTLSECNLTIHGKDIDRVMQYLRPKYRSIAVVGHSLGCPSILKSNTGPMDIVIFWEPSHMTPSRAKRIKKLHFSDRTLFMREGAFNFLMRKTMIKEWKEFDGERELKKISRIDKPLLIIAAQKGVLVEGCKSYFEAAQDPKQLKIIDQANHCFDQEGKEEEVLELTLDWIKKHST